jgi:hypothetical protein
MPKRILKIMTTLLVGIVIILIFRAQHAKGLHKGSRIPALSYAGINGKKIIEEDTDGYTFLLWFYPDCEQCQYQLQILEDHIDKFKNRRFFLLTGKRKYINEKLLSIWPNLGKSPNVSFGFVDASRFIQLFGPAGFPTWFVFNREGVLIAKMYGEVKARKIYNLANQ